MIVSIWKNLWCLSPSYFPWDIARIFVILGTWRMAGYAHLKLYYQFVKNLGIYFYAKNFIPHVFWTIAKICEFLILGTLGMSGHTHPSNVSICRKLQWLPVCQK